MFHIAMFIIQSVADFSKDSTTVTDHQKDGVRQTEPGER